MAIPVQTIYQDTTLEVPAVYVLPPGSDWEFASSTVRVDGSAASDTFIVVFDVLSQDGRLIEQARTDQEFAIGDTGVVSFAPFLRRRAAASTDSKVYWMKAVTDGFSAATGAVLPAFTDYDTNNEKMFPGLSSDDYPLIDPFYGIHGYMTVGVQIHSVAREKFHRIALAQTGENPFGGVFITVPPQPSAALWVPAGGYTIPSGPPGSAFSMSFTSFIMGDFGTGPGTDRVKMRVNYEHDAATSQSIDVIWITVITWPEGEWVDP